MLPSPVTRQSLIKMLRVIDKELGEVSPSLLPWIESYFNGTEFPKAGEEKKEIQMQLDILTKVTEKFFRDWEYGFTAFTYLAETYSTMVFSGE